MTGTPDTGGPLAGNSPAGRERDAVAGAARGGASGVAALRAGLRRARESWRRRCVLGGAAFGALSGLAVLCGLELPAAVLGVAAPVSGPGAVVIGLAIALAFALAAGALAIALAPDDAALARRGDRAFSLGELLSTALETQDALTGAAAVPAAAGPVWHALLAEAEHCAAGIAPRQWASLGAPRRPFAVPVLSGAVGLFLAVFLGVLAAGGPPGPGVPRGAPGGGGAPEPWRSEAAADLRAVADAVARDADTDGKAPDGDLRALARALDRLGEEVGRGADRGAVAFELDRLFKDAQRLYGRAGEAGKQNPLDLIRSALNRDVRKGARPADGNAGDSTVADAQAGTSPGEAPRTGAPARTAVPPGPGPAAPRPGQEAGEGGGFEGDARMEADLRAQVDRVVAEQRRLHGGAQPAGAAQDAGAGEGDRAGNGSRPLGSAADGARKLAAGADMLLPDQGGAGGRIRIEIAPDAARAEVAAAPAAAAGAQWRRFGEGPVDRPAPATPQQRRALARYFGGREGEAAR